MWVVTQNIGSLYTAAERHLATRADIYAWQEVEVAKNERQITADRIKDLNYTIRYGWEENASEVDEIRSKVAMAFAKGVKPYALEYHDSDAVQMVASGRWCERMVSIGGGDKFMVVASLYGYSSESQDTALAKRNVELLRSAA